MCTVRVKCEVINERGVRGWGEEHKGGWEEKEEGCSLLGKIHFSYKLLKVAKLLVDEILKLISHMSLKIHHNFQPMMSK